MRKPFQGTWNIIRFNWHFYVLSFLLMGLLWWSAGYFDLKHIALIQLLITVFASTTILSLIISYYVYDLSELYSFNWVDDKNSKEAIVNINAGFDETSSLLKEKFKNSELFVFDFYEPARHTEVSIKRARKAYPPFPGTRNMKTERLDLKNDSADKVIIFLSAHEIRNESERIQFFKEINRILKPEGEVFVTEHLRDPANFLAYTIGFFHFHSHASWLKVFENAGLAVKKEIKQTPFISTFKLTRNGNSL